MEHLSLSRNSSYLVWSLLFFSWIRWSMPVISPNPYGYQEETFWCLYYHKLIHQIHDTRTSILVSLLLTLKMSVKSKVALNLLAHAAFNLLAHKLTEHFHSTNLFF